MDFETPESIPESESTTVMLDFPPNHFTLVIPFSFYVSRKLNVPNSNRNVSQNISVVKKVLFSLGFAVKSAMFCWNITNSALSSLSLTSSRFPSYNHILLLLFFCKTFPFISMLTLFVYNTGYLSRAVSVSNLICQSVKSSFRKNFI